MLIVIAFVILGGGSSYLIFGNTAPQPIEKKIIPAFLQTDSTPPGANVFINGMFKGKTPVRLELSLEGKYEVRLTLPDYHDWEAQVQLKDKGETPLFVELIPVENAGK